MIESPPRLDPLASVEDFEMVNGRTVVEEERPRVELLLAAASNRVRHLTGQTLSAADSEEVHDGRRSDLLQLNEAPVIDIHRVSVEDHVMPCDRYRVDLTTATLWRRGIWWGERQGIRVSYRHGWEAIPEDLVLVVASMAERALTAGEGGGPQGPIESERFGPYTYRFANAGLGGVGLTGAEQDTINAYRLRRQVIP